jgi:hypothetical protein
VIICGIIGSMTADSQALQHMTDDQRAWALRSEAVWREAHAIVAGHPGLDAGDVYHALRALDLSPAERLHRGLTRVRRRPHAG